MQQDISDLKVPVTDSEGKTVLEAFNPGGQSDGSMYTIPKKLVSDDHEHYFEKKKPEDRHVMCECGFGGEVYPHNSVYKDGHIYNLKGNKVI